MEDGTSLRVGELARHTRISVRTLHHYEEIGLLRPSGRTAAGHRVYTRGDLERLQQIISLRDLGLALREIALCLDVDRASLRQVLESHARALEQSIAIQEKTRQRLASLLLRLQQGVSMHDLLKSIEEMKRMQEQKWSTEFLEQFRQRTLEVGAELFQATQAENRNIMREVGEAFRRGDPPDHPAVLELARRSREVRQVITGGDPHFAAQLRRWNDEGFARDGPQGRYTDPALIAYLHSAGSSSAPSEAGAELSDDAV
jgi:DNA-binding transcriptional MerR regulator